MSNEYDDEQAELLRIKNELRRRYLNKKHPPLTEEELPSGLLSGPLDRRAFDKMKQELDQAEQEDVETEEEETNDER